MLCSSCASKMYSKINILGSGVTRQELRCPRCGDQCIKSVVTLDGEPFEMDPFRNFKAMEKQNASITQQNSETSTPGDQPTRHQTP